MTDAKDKLVSLDGLKAALDYAGSEVNDYTTGINLLRGTRDFRIGLDKKYSANNASDGFVNRGNVNFGTDESGFVYIESKNNLALRMQYSEVPIEVFANIDKITISAEFMLDDGVTVNNADAIALYALSRTGGSTVDAVKESGTEKYISAYLRGVDPTPNKWLKGKQTFTLKHANFTDEYVVITGYINLATSGIKVRKLMMQIGEINFPIWSPSPFDVAQSSDVLTKDTAIYNLGYIEPDRQIKSGADLNTFLDAGTYVCNSSGLVSSMSNLPSGVDRAFKLYVDHPTGGTGKLYVWQKLVVFDSAAEYIRYSGNTGSSWTTWRQTYANTTVRPIEGGGTNSNTAKGARNNINNELTELTTDATDTTAFMLWSSSASDHVVRRSGLRVWNWIASKIRSVFGFTSDDKLPADRIEGSIGGSGIETWPSGNVADLEDGIYICTGSNESYESNYGYETYTKYTSGFPADKTKVYVFAPGHIVVKYGPYVNVLACDADTSNPIGSYAGISIYKSPIITFIGNISTSNKVNKWTVQEQQIPDLPDDKDNKFLNANLEWEEISGGGEKKEYECVALYGDLFESYYSAKFENAFEKDDTGLVLSKELSDLMLSNKAMVQITFETNSVMYQTNTSTMKLSFKHMGGEYAETSFITYTKCFDYSPNAKLNAVFVISDPGEIDSRIILTLFNDKGAISDYDKSKINILVLI